MASDRAARRFRLRLLVPGLMLLTAAALVLAVPHISGPHDKATLEWSSLAGLILGVAGLTLAHFSAPANPEDVQLIRPAQRTGKDR